MSTKRKSFVARVLDSPTIRRISPFQWRLYRKTTAPYRELGYPPRAEPPATGDLLVQSPYNQWFNLVWGVSPNADLPKWRWMYRARPEVKRGIDTKVILAVGRGFTVTCKGDEEVEKFVNRLLIRLNLRDLAQSLMTDALVYGTAWGEKIRALPDELQATEKPHVGEGVAPEARVTKTWKDLDFNQPSAISEWVADVERVDRWMAQTTIPNRESEEDTLPNGEGKLVDIKKVDPIYMRVNRDAFDNIIGHVQWGVTPIPQSIEPDKMVFIRWMPKSWAHESAYGTSILMPIQRHVSLLVQAEEDMKVWFHQYARPMLAVYAGTPEHPVPVAQLQALRDKFADRQPNSDMILPGDFKAEVIGAGTGETTNTFAAWSKYLVDKIYESIGMPTVFAEGAEGANRSEGDVRLQIFLAEQRMIQDLFAEQFLQQVVEPEVRRQFTQYAEQPLPDLQVVWPPIVEEDWNRRMDRLIKAAGRPFMTINEARGAANLGNIDEEWADKLEEVPMLAKGPFGQPSLPEPSESERTGVREETLQKRDRDYEASAQAGNFEITDTAILKECRQYNTEYTSPASTADVAFEFAPPYYQTVLEEWLHSRDGVRIQQLVEAKLIELSRQGKVKKVEGGWVVT